ncbi:MAG TPA: VOC family protein [Steroidobacteraceae bacterium]|jgi:catechol 2,3-dioxygenase-like lactoylglutathione lyase family enzyme|nr:VOC family protein [Steroidobacteraceae bacterium]
MTCSVNHIGIRVRDMDRMLNFYRQAFGFETARVISDGKSVPSEYSFSRGAANRPADARVPRVVMLRTGNCFIEVMEDLNGQPNEAEPRGYTQLSVEVENLDREFERLKTLGATFNQPAPIDLGYVKVVTGFDPEGNQLELQQTRNDYECSLTRVSG